VAQRTESGQLVFQQSEKMFCLAELRVPAIDFCIQDPDLDLPGFRFKIIINRTGSGALLCEIMKSLFFII